jgi:tryptophan halogenase
LLANLDGAARAAPRILRFVTGRRKRFWVKNCVALGLASGFLEPLESTSIHLVQSGVAQLMSLFPDRGFSAPEIDQYNRVMTYEYERVRDLLVLHYHATGRSEPFWNYCSTMSVPESLKQRIELFRERGRIFLESNELFKDNSWFAVLTGQDIQPRGYDPLVDALTDDELRRRLAHIRETIAKCVATMPDHREFIARHCAATAP